MGANRTEEENEMRCPMQDYRTVSVSRPMRLASLAINSLVTGSAYTPYALIIIPLRPYFSEEIA